MDRSLGHAGFDVTRRPAFGTTSGKVWGNMTDEPGVGHHGGPLLTGCSTTPRARFCSAAMPEAASIGAKIGCANRADTQTKRNAITRKLCAFKTVDCCGRRGGPGRSKSTASSLSRA